MNIDQHRRDHFFRRLSLQSFLIVPNHQVQVNSDDLLESAESQLQYLAVLLGGGFDII